MRITRLVSLALSVITAAAVSMPTTVSAAADPPSPAAAPSLEAVFNKPVPTGTAGYGRTIENKLKELIGKATPTSRIRVSLYIMEDREIADALIAAQARGTDVRVLSERCRWSGPNLDCAVPLPEVQRLAQSLGNGPDNRPRVVLCNKGCMQTKDINHDKFWLFSEVSDGRTNVAVQSSHNLSKTSPGLADNMLISSNDAQIHQGYEHTWDTMLSKEIAGETAAIWPQVDAGGTGDFSGHAGKAAGWRFPRSATQGGVVNDPVARSIRALDCATRPQVHIAMASWGGRTEVDAAIKDKIDNGAVGGNRCAFRILVAGSPEKALALEPNAAHPNRDVQVWAVTMNQLNGASGGLHSKYTLLSWEDAAGPHRVVHTGSDNFNNPAVTSADETHLRITDARIYDDFKANWDWLRAQNDLTANGLTALPFLATYPRETPSSAPYSARPFTFGTTGHNTFRDPKNSPQVISSPAGAAHRTARGDVNGDGVPDLVTLNDEGVKAGKATFSLETFLGKPDGRYSAGTTSWSANSDWGWFTSMRLTSGDYNGDGRDDIAALYTYAGNGDRWKIFTFLAHSDGTFSGPKTGYENTSGFARTSEMQLVSGKFDPDGRDDIAVLSSADGLGLHTFTAKADGTFNPPFRSWTTTNTGASYWGAPERTRIVSGNFDGKGGADIAALYDYEGGSAVGLHTFLSKADGGFHAPFQAWKVTNTPDNRWGTADRMRLTTGDLNGDGIDDIASLYGFTTVPEMAVHIFGGRPDGTFNPPFRGWVGAGYTWGNIQVPAA
ncbi:phospholipase D-like domain-containing protein [Streptomyces sp. NPDC001889]